MARRNQYIPAETQRGDWKDHPLVVAAISAAGTFTLVTFAFKEIIIPTQIADIHNKIRDLPTMEQTINQLRAENKKHLSSIGDLQRVVEGLQQKDLLKFGNPFPQTIDRIRIGQDVDTASTEFPNAKIEKDEDMGHWTVQLDYGVIPKATYYFDEGSKSRKVTHILFWLSDKMKFSESFLLDRLTDALGKPTANPRKGYYEWRLRQYSVFMHDPDSYVVMDLDLRPGIWPD